MAFWICRNTVSVGAFVSLMNLPNETDKLHRLGYTSILSVFSCSRENVKIFPEFEERHKQLLTIIVEIRVSGMCDRINPWLKHIRCSFRSVHTERQAEFNMFVTADKITTTQAKLKPFKDRYGQHSFWTIVFIDIYWYFFCTIFNRVESDCTALDAIILKLMGANWRRVVIGHTNDISKWANPCIWYLIIQLIIK